MIMREDDVRGILNTLRLPDKSMDVGSHLLSVIVEKDSISLILEGATEQAENLQKLKELCEDELATRYQNVKINCAITTQRPVQKSPPRQPLSKLELPGVKNIVAVASGKGGVGKSTLTVNLAIALAQLGQKVGILDADIYGPSLPKMLGLTEKPGATGDKKLIPLTKYGIKCMSIGLMIPQDTPMIWRGPMVQGALQQMLKDVVWGELDFLMVDMPPGTGDAQLTMAQQVSLKGAIIVSTPQDIALIDARKGINMFRQVAVPVLGIVENMSVFQCPSCGHESHIFSHGGAKQTAQDMNIPFLGEIPLHMGLRLGADAGTPYNQEYPEDKLSESYRTIATALIESVKSAGRAQPVFEVIS